MFEPGKVIKAFKSKSGKDITLRYVKWEDLNNLLLLINELSQEDTFIYIGNKEIKREEEIEFLADLFKKSEKIKVMFQLFTKMRLSVAVLLTGIFMATDQDMLV